MNCVLCDKAASHAYKTEGRGWRGLCQECYHNSTSILQSYCKRLAPMVCGREV